MKRDNIMFEIPIIGFISALFLVFVVFYLTMVVEVMRMHFMLGFAISLWIISVVFNIISTVIISGERKEIVPEKRTKILIIVTWCLIALATWCLIAFGLVEQFYLFLLFSW